MHHMTRFGVLLTTLVCTALVADDASAFGRRRDRCPSPYDSAYGDGYGMTYTTEYRTVTRTICESVPVTTMQDVTEVVYTPVTKGEDRTETVYEQVVETVPVTRTVYKTEYVKQKQKVSVLKPVTRTVEQTYQVCVPV